jgi:carbon monoxide dehydrogenase subunit G
MASIRTEAVIQASPEKVWAAIRDTGALHTRLVVGFVTDCHLDGDARIVTFANGVVARETIVDLDDRHRRLVWAAVGGKLAHHNASLQVFADDTERTRVVWIADLLPNELAPVIQAMMEQGTAAMKKTLESAASSV